MKLYYLLSDKSNHDWVDIRVQMFREVKGVNINKFVRYEDIYGHISKCNHYESVNFHTDFGSDGGLIYEANDFSSFLSNYQFTTGLKLEKVSREFYEQKRKELLDVFFHKKCFDITEAIDNPNIPDHHMI